MAARLVTLLVAAASLLLALNGTAAAQCCAARLGVCRDDAIVAWADCNNECFAVREDALEACERNPRPLCALIEVFYARCQRRCDGDRVRDQLFCLVRYRSCLTHEKLCQNTATPTVTFTRTVTPSPGIDPDPSIGARPTPTPPPPDGAG